MQLMDILNQVGGVQAMAREFGVTESQAASGAAALLPAILGGFKKQAQTQTGGLEGLGGLLGQLGGGGLLDNVLSPQPTDLNLGNDVLGQIFGSRDVSRSVAQHASRQSGLDPALLKKMLPVLAMLVAGYMARSAGSAGAAQAGVGGGALAQGGEAPGLGGLGALGGILGQLAGGTSPANAGAPGLGALLDLNRDGNPLDDILGMASKMLR
jgi:hypothetical protein